MFQMKLLGTSGMCPLPNRALASCFVRIAGVGFLIDCGEGTQVELQRRKIGVCDIDYILITHLHADHVSGLLGVLLAMQMQDRYRPLKIIGPIGIKEYVRGFLQFIRGLSFKYEIEEIRGEKEYKIVTCHSSTKLNLSVGVCEHSVPCFCYSFELKRNKRFNKNAEGLGELPIFSRNFLAMGRDIIYNGKTYYAKNFLEPAYKGVKFSYVTDTRPTPYLKKFVADSDLVVIEGMFADECKVEDARKKRHMTWEESCMLVENSNVQKFILTHFSPSLQVDERIKKEFSKKHPKGIIGVDGYTIDMKYPTVEDKNVNISEEVKNICIPLNINKAMIILQYYKDSHYGKVKDIVPITDFKYQVYLGSGKVDKVFLYKTFNSMSEEYNGYKKYGDYHLFAQIN